MLLRRANGHDLPSLATEKCRLPTNLVHIEIESRYESSGESPYAEFRINVLLIIDGLEETGAREHSRRCWLSAEHREVAVNKGPCADMMWARQFRDVESLLKGTEQ